MVEVVLPYGRQEIRCNIPDERVNAILTTRAEHYQTQASEETIVKEALLNPVGTARLREQAEEKKKVTIISNDHTRPLASHITMPLLLEEIRKGNPGAEITILVATGCHRAPTGKELREKYGERIINEENIVLHNSCDERTLVGIGELPSGGELIVNRLAIEADLLLAEGFIEPHFFAGFSGGRKSILPGIVSRKTVLANHCAEFIAHEKARAGILAGNPIHEDMIFAAEKVGLSFILNVVIDNDKKIIKAFAGHREQAHLQGCRFVSELNEVKKANGGIVITTNGGYPLDQNIYQAVKGMTAAESTCSKGGVIIAVDECSDGHGSESFFKTFAEEKSIEDIMAKIMARDRDMTVPDQWESQILARILLNHHVIMVTAAPRKMVEAMHLDWAADLEDAIELAEKLTGNRNNGITIIPDGVTVIIK